MDSVAYIDEAGEIALGGIAGPVPWWSVSKTVLAVAALRLVETGALSLAAPVDDAGFTLAQLLRHEAGLPDYGGLAQYHADVAAGAAPWPVDRLLAETEAGCLRYGPGTGWAYSNIGYLKVRGLIERVSGLPLAEALRRLVFAPAKLATARLALVPADLADVAMGAAHGDVAGGYHPGWVYHGLMVGTTADAARLLHALATGRLLRPATLALMLAGRPLPEHRSALHPDPAYGLGLMLRARDPRDHPLGHGGGGPGSRIAAYAQGGRACALWSTEAADPTAAVFARLVG
jgi:CubicO group peptidase (beta-lactamase class C family)